jgi:hypothetical protein
MDLEPHGRDELAYTPLVIIQHTMPFYPHQAGEQGDLPFPE